MYTSASENLFYFIAAPALIMTFIFFVFGIFGILRLKLVFSIPNPNKISLLFYIFLTLEAFLSTSTYLYVAIKSYLVSTSSTPTADPFEDKILITFQFLPDLFFWILFTLLLWQLLVLFYSTHINNKMKPLLSKKNNFLSKKTLFNIFLAIWLIYLLIQLLFISLFQADVISFNSFTEQNSLFNLLLPFILFIIEVYLHVHFSGTPYISLLASNKKGIVNKVLLVWAIGRIFHAIWSVFLAFYEPNVFKKIMEEQVLDNSTYDEMLLIVGLEIADKIIDEFLAFIFVFDLEFVRIFYQFKEDHEQSLEEVTFDEIAINKGLTSSSGVATSLLKQPIEYPNLGLIENEELTQKLSKKNGFGTLQYCFIHPNISEKYLVRKINMKGFTHYIAEEFIEDLTKYYELQNQENLRLNKIINYCIQESKNEKFLYIILNYYENGSLGNLLTSQNNLNFEVKVQTAFEICSLFQRFHSCDPPFIHGHLNSENILFDEDFKPIISDYGFFSLKKYYSLMHSYQQKTIFTAPEALQSTQYKREKSMDVYSFALILYELFVEKLSKENVPLKRLIKLVCEEKARPKIPEEFDKKLANLIRCCWQEDPTQRPNFNQIKEILGKILN